MKREFEFLQSRDVAKYIKKKYAAAPEYLWARSPADCIMRRGDNQKWFAGIFHVRRSRIDGGADDTRIEILNLRCAPVMTEMIVDKKLIFPGWHMNKHSWITVILDGRVETENLRALIDNSYVLTGGK